MSIKILSDSTINKISAGEVIERPASVIKELVENSIDAGASEIKVFLERAGKNLIVVSDNGSGMNRKDLALSVQRHATSKLKEDDLLDINSFGFRGEALPSIAAISKFKITSKHRSENIGYSLSISGGLQSEIMEAAIDEGTIIEVRDLFFSTPARLKFLRSDKTELMAIVAFVKKLALSHPSISFNVNHDGKDLLKLRKKEGDFDKTLNVRINDLMGEDFIKNAVYVDFQRDGIRLFGYTSIPTYNKAAAEDQFLFINNRPVKDKILSIALKVAYQDFLARDRHAAAALFLHLDPHLVDVNVHPAKTEVRFHDPVLIRQIFSSGIKEALNSGGQRVSSTLADTAINYMRPSYIKLRQGLQAQYQKQEQGRLDMVASSNLFHVAEEDYSNSHKFRMPIDETKRSPDSAWPSLDDSLMQFSDAAAVSDICFDSSYLGAAKAQLHDTYIISQTEDSVIITDQHAAHERLGYEKIKEQIRKNGIIKQRLLIPEIVELSSLEKMEIIYDNKSNLSDLGLSVEKFGTNSVIISEIPSLLGDIDVQKLINDIADHLLAFGENVALTELIEHVTETYACHYAIRAGRKLSILEMNELLRQMENTPFSAQCNHGRPTYVKLDLKDIEKLFGRK